jgi:hypothetical protein
MQDVPVLVRSGLGLQDCVTETCIAVKVTKRQASETLKLVRDYPLQLCWATAAFSHDRRPSPTAAKPAITLAIANGRGVVMTATFWSF